MINPRLTKEKKSIDDLFVRINKFGGDPIDKALLTQYLCIRVSGFLENCVRIIFTEYSAIRAIDHVKTFVDNKLDRFPNPSYGAILDLTKQFNDKWQSNLQKVLVSKHQTSLESIIRNRNKIAHGQSSTINLTDLKTYYDDAVEVIEKLETTCK